MRENMQYECEREYVRLDFLFLIVIFFAVFQKIATEITIHYKSKKKVKQQIT